MMTEDTVKTLQKKAESDPIASAVFHLMAYRQRNRHIMTTRGLYYKLRKEGFKYQEKDLIPLFRLLAELGLAQLEVDYKGRVEAVRNFKTPIQKIGEIACTPGRTQEQAKSINVLLRPTLVSVPKIQAAAPKPPAPKPPATVLVPTKVKETVKAAITLYVNDKAIEINLPEKLSKEELTIVLSKFYGV